MPRVVDHDERRRAIVDAYLEVGARDGLSAATSRAVAAHLGVAAGSLWHYFPNFDAVLVAAFQRVFENTNERIRVASTGLEGLSGLHAMLMELLPLQPVTKLEASIVVSFWGLLATHEELSDQHARIEEDWSGRIREYLHQAVDRGELVAETPVGRLGDTLQLLASSLQIESVARTRTSSLDNQLGLVEHCLRPWRV